MSIANPFHDGEQLVQQRLGQVEIAERNPTNETNGTRRYWTLFVEQWL